MKKEIKRLILNNEKNNLNTINQNINNNNNIDNSNILFTKRSSKKSNVHFNDFNIKNATSIVKEYIKGKIKENEVYIRRRSVNSPDLESIKEYNHISLNQIYTPSKRIKRNNVKHHTQRLENIDDLYEDSEEDSETEEEENEIIKDDNKVVKNYEFQKYLFKVSGKNDDLIIERGKKSAKKLKSKNSEGNNALKIIQLSRQLYQNRKSSMNSAANNSELIENQDKKYNTNNGFSNFYITNSVNLNKNKKNISKSIEPNKSKEKDNNESSILEKSKKYEKIKDVKTIIKVIKKESRENFIPSLQINKLTFDKLPNNKNDENKDNKLDNQNNDNKNSINIKNFNQRNKNINKIYSKTKDDYSRSKFSNTPSKLGHQKYAINSNSLKLPLYENKKLNKAISAGKLTSKNKWHDAKKIDINFKSYEENSKEKEEKKMKKIFNQIKDYLPPDEKAMIKDRFIKYGYDKEKIFNNEQPKNKNKNLDEIIINLNGINGFFNINKNNNIILPKGINFERK